MVSLKHYDIQANMLMRCVVKNVHRKTRKPSPKYTICRKKISDSGTCIYFDTNFEMMWLV